METHARTIISALTGWSAKRWLKCVIFISVFIGVFAVSVITLYAKIYKWRDAQGLIHYSNTPPADTSLLLGEIPTTQIPLVEDAEGKLYYLNIPTKLLEQATTTAPGQAALPPDVLQELLQQVPTDVPAAAPKPTVDLTAFTLRLADLETRITTLQDAVAMSDTRLDGSQEPSQQVSLLQGEIDNVATTVAARHQELSEKITTLSAKLQEFASLPQSNVPTEDKLRSFEIEIARLTDQLPASQTISTLISELIDNQNSLQSIVIQQQEKITALEEEISQVNAQSSLVQSRTVSKIVLADASSANLPISQNIQNVLAELTEKNTYLEVVIKHQTKALNIQNEQIKTITATLARLQKSDALASDAEKTALGGIKAVPHELRSDTGLPWHQKFTYLFKKGL